MTPFWFHRIWNKVFHSSSRSGRKPIRRNRIAPTFDALADRVMPAISASFNPTAGLLSVYGDAADNNITVSRDAAGTILINGGAVSIVGGRPSVGNTTTISVFGLAGNDVIQLDETNGALPSAQLFGGDGNDTLIGGSAADLLFGQAGNDILLGKGGDDLLFGGDGNDTLTGGVGNDQVFGEGGNDLMIWNPGEGTDLNEGGDGIDTVQVNGGNGAENFTVTPNGTRVRFDRISPAPFSLDIGTSENLVVNMNGGDDTFTASNGLAPLIHITVDGGAGNDTITGGDGNDNLIGGDGNDVINGGRGNDIVDLGTGDDTFVWNPGDGSDKVDGGDGNDTMVFNGANINEQVNISAHGSRVQFTRDVAAITMDLGTIENINFNALGGADTITVGDLTGTGVQQVNVSLESTPGSGVGDGQADAVIVNGTRAADNIVVSGQGTSASVFGLSAQVNITGAEGAFDSLTVNALGGDDGVDASQLPTGILHLTIDGGAGNDRIIGSQGADTLIGGDGNDFLDGKQGADVVSMGAGNDEFEWDPGDGSDTVDGGTGNDEMLFFGSNASESFNVSANANHVIFTRDVGAITMDLVGIESTELRTLGGADNVTVNDLTGTDLKTFEISLAGPDGGPDGALDSVTVNGSQGDDRISVGGDSGGVRVTGLHTTVSIFYPDAGVDPLTINGLGGNDTINAQSLRGGTMPLTINGGDGDDVITGSDGADLILGGRGNDTVRMGGGDDTFVWNPGDGSDTVDGQDGNDTMIFNGANINENINLSANGKRLRFTRDVANIVMDVGTTEVIDFNALGGADTITVGDLSKTDVAAVNLNLESTPGSGVGDGAADTVIVNGTAKADTIQVASDATGVAVTGLKALVHITGAEGANDALIVNAGDGDDVVQASGLAAGSLKLTADGGNGADVLVGSHGNDTLLGGAGDDVLIGNGGVDVLDGGTGLNVLI